MVATQAVRQIALINFKATGYKTDPQKNRISGGLYGVPV
jgi:hypothetical protein